MDSFSQVLSLAMQHHRAGKLPAAEQLYRQILQADPDQPDAHNLLGLLAHQVGQHQAGVELIERAIQLKGNDPAYHNNLGEALRGLGRLDDAILSYRKALKLNPNHVESLSNLASSLFESGKLDDAVAHFRCALKIDRDYAEIHNNLGAVLREQGKIDEAIACHRRALKIKPNFAEAHNNLGTAYVAQRNRDDAIACFRRAIELNPNFAKGHYNLGHELFEQRQLDEAIGCYHQALALNPSYVEAHYNLGLALNDRGRLDEAVASYRRALELKPNYSDALNNLGNALMAQGQLREGMNCFLTLLSLTPSARYFSNYLMCLVYDSSVSLANVHQEHVRFGTTFGVPAAAWPQFENRPDPGRRLRLGYISADFREHAVASFIDPILSHHEHEQFEVFCYSNNAWDDEVTEGLRTFADHWREIKLLDDDALVRLIRADQIDVLVELSGHSAGNRLTALARKPAPVQVTYIGYPATTGLVAIDYRFTDDVLNPVTETSHHVETVYRLPCGSACYVPRAGCPEAAPLPALTRGYLTFGAPHTLAKLNAGVIDLWARILHALPTAHLAIFRDSLLDTAIYSLHNQFAQRGITADRLEISRHSTATHGYSGYMSKYHDVDIGLDTFPANAGTTACESLWMGVPWLTLYGDRFFGRMTASLSTRLGLSEWVAQTPDILVEKAVFWSQHWSELATIRGDLRRRFGASTLGNPQLYTHGLEAAYRDIWQGWCEKQDAVPSPRN